ncbi:UvrD-helicase domain-containing protein [Maridesulfovibrio ferrireducens]|uniref:UvrD-helicase domain-containing protein n=1 Tax=Maridesulfovibrio ferrireducens TaxID=246191 RepID=UPI001A2B2A28|nr:UvrD-helicase domain-containing protein [Maridesulfovibrio ferrireducens]MBI9111850.1 UvrD-helicase domain-containing protein [Maridesulfovibrio ferrireducens]
MERFIADLHIHSRFSRATSKGLTARLLAAWARIKGIDVIGTGDFTHPEWLQEIEEQLVEDGSGLLSLRSPQGLENEIDWVDGPLAGQTRFMLQTEISSIYKRLGKTRKVHNLVYMPDLESVRKFNAKLGAIGNLNSDGRPILGLDSKDLLEIVLETSDRAFLVPAHIWTPWFSLFGSKSGFDSVEECYGDLSSEIFAMETGLSSDPEMNWLISSLDKYRLISNSDAHSAENLGREANIFRGDMSYEGIYRALRGEGLGHKFMGTVEFFPEEGKYHMDGHRNCGIMLDPHESKMRGGICPVCGKPLTIGVYSRILELADREDPVQPKGQPGFTSLVPLRELISEVVGTGPKTKKVMNVYSPLIKEFGSEFSVLQQVSLEDLKRHNVHLAEGIRRMREGQVIRNPGFDGQYGTVSVYSAHERDEILNGMNLVVVRREADDLDNGKGQADILKTGELEARPKVDSGVVKFNDAQKKAIEEGPAPVLVIAGPGTGKTQTLMGRIKYLLERGTRARRILALTFTRKAAQEMNERMQAMLGEDEVMPRADTIHALAFEYWVSMFEHSPIILNGETARRVFARANPQLTGLRLKSAWESLCLCRETLETLSEELEKYNSNYSRQKDQYSLVDYTDLLEFWLGDLSCGKYIRTFTHFLVDEVQDLSPLQLEIIRKLAGVDGVKKGEGDGEGLFAIGDPDQSIYGFRGAAGNIVEKFKSYWPNLIEITLEDNYRSAQAVLNVSASVLKNPPKLIAHKNYEPDMQLFSAPDGIREASWIADRIKHLLGSTSHSLGDSFGHGTFSPGDIAVLVRFKGLMGPIENILKRQGIPCSIPEAEMFWHDSRVEILLGAARRMLGFAESSDDDSPEVPEKIIARGPLGLSAYLSEMPPFDQLFWESTPFRKMVKGYEENGGWTGLINWIHMQNDRDQVRNKAEKVRIMSMHAAKGLEFDAVFLAGLDDGIVPFVGIDVLTGNFSGGAGTGIEDVEEERRLLYVGMTRAKKNLYLSHAAKRPLYGRTLRLPISRFLKNIPEDSVKKSAMIAKVMQKEKKISLLDM